MHEYVDGTIRRVESGIIGNHVTNHKDKTEKGQVLLSFFETKVEEEESDFYNQSEDDDTNGGVNSSDNKILWQAKDFSIRVFQSMQLGGDLKL
jgi:hypothetical protein